MFLTLHSTVGIAQSCYQNHLNLNVLILGQVIPSKEILTTFLNKKDISQKKNPRMIEKIKLYRILVVFCVCAPRVKIERMWAKISAFEFVRKIFVSNLMLKKNQTTYECLHYRLHIIQSCQISMSFIKIIIDKSTIGLCNLFSILSILLKSTKFKLVGKGIMMIASF